MSQPPQQPPQPNQIKGDPRPQNYERLYVDLLESMAEIGLSLQIQARNTLAQYRANWKAREELLRQEQEEKQMQENPSQQEPPKNV